MQLSDVSLSISLMLNHESSRFVSCYDMAVQQSTQLSLDVLVCKV
jgi:hypothetical protein